MHGWIEVYSEKYMFIDEYFMIIFQKAQISLQMILTVDPTPIPLNGIPSLTILVLMR